MKDLDLFREAVNCLSVAPEAPSVVGTEFRDYQSYGCQWWPQRRRTDGAGLKSRDDYMIIMHNYRRCIRTILHQHRPQTVGYTLGHILCLFSLNATDLRCLCGFIWLLSPNGDDMPVWFQSAPGLDHDYGQITTSVVLLGVQVADVRRGYLGGRRRRRVPAPAPASPGAGAGITS